MKVLHLHDAPHILGGATMYLRQLVPALSERGVEAAIFSLDEPASDLAPEFGHFAYEWPDSRWKRRRAFAGFHEPLAAALSEFVALAQPDLVHVQNVVPFRSTIFPTLRATGLPVLMTAHDYTIVDPDPPGTRQRGWLMRKLDQGMVRRGQAAIREAVSRMLFPTQTLLEASRVAPRRAEVLRLPIMAGRDAPPPDGPLTFFFAGTLYHSKGIDLLLRAFAAAQGPARDARLRIAGSGDEEPGLRELAAGLGIADRVEWLGTCGPEEMEAAYASSAVQVLPSRVKENSPLTVLEAGVRGRPSIVSHSGGSPELVAPPERGWSFPSEDVAGLTRALEEAASDPAEVQRRGARMKEWVRAECDPGRHWDRLHSLYKEVCR